MLHVKNILVPTDLSEIAGAAYSYAVALARRFEAQLHVLHVCSAPRTADAGPPDLLPFSSADVVEDLRLPALAEIAAPIQVEVQEASVPASIIRYAHEHEVDLIVMGGRGRSGLRFPHLGGVAGCVVRYAPCPVLTVRHALPTVGLKRLLVPVDFSEPSRATLAAAKRIAAMWDCTVDLLHVLKKVYEPSMFAISPPPQLAPFLAGKWEADLRDFWDEVDGPDVPFLPHIRTGPPGPEIINLALQLRSDLIVIGTHGKTGLRRLMLGSVAESVIYHALCATLTVKSFERWAIPPAAYAETIPIAS